MNNENCQFVLISLILSTLIVKEMVLMNELDKLVQKSKKMQSDIARSTAILKKNKIKR